jgi:hypothetical protein
MRLRAFLVVFLLAVPRALTEELPDPGEAAQRAGQHNAP